MTANQIAARSTPAATRRAMYRQVAAMSSLVLADLWESDDATLREISLRVAHERAESYALDQELRRITR